MGIGGSFLGVKRLRREADHSLQSIAERKCGSTHLLLHTPSWRSTELVELRDNFTFFYLILHNKTSRVKYEVTRIFGT
jgi:hypothetical protein